MNTALQFTMTSLNARVTSPVFLIDCIEITGVLGSMPGKGFVKLNPSNEKYAFSLLKALVFVVLDFAGVLLELYLLVVAVSEELLVVY